MTEAHASGGAIALAIAILALLLVRGLSAALEAALVAVGLTRAQERAAAPGAGRAARALEALLADPEPTSFTLRFTGTTAVLFSGFLSGRLGAELAPSMPWTSGAIAAIVA